MEKLPHILKTASKIIARKDLNKNTERTKIVGILGTDRGVGTTHLSVMLGNYLANGLGMKVAVVEFNDHNDYCRIRKQTGESFAAVDFFSCCNMVFYKNMDAVKIAEVVAQDYDIVVLDMEYTYSNCYSEFLRSDIRIVVGGVEMWKVGKLKGFLLDTRKLSTDVYHCVTLSYNRKEAKELEHEFGVKILVMPYERDPFLISSDSLLWLNSITNRLPLDRRR